MGTVVVVTFEAASYDASHMAFPVKGSCRRGDEIKVLTEMQFRDRIQRWLRCALRASLQSPFSSETGGAADIESPATLHGRRSGAAACAGWFNTVENVRKRHLTALHWEEADASMEYMEWITKMAQLADAQGIYPTRGGSSCRTKASASRVHVADLKATELQLGPGLRAARDGDASTLRKLLADGWRPLSPGEQDHHGSSAVDWAAGNGHLECVKLLLPYTEGLQLCRKDGRGPLHWACRHGQLEMLGFLIDAGVGHVDDRAADGTTMLMLACFGGHTHVADGLLSLRADLMARNSYDCDAGHFAGLGGSIDACKFLREKGLCLTRPQCSGHTALHKAAERGHASLARFLIASNAMEEVRDACPQQMPDNRRKAHLPSALARRHGHEICAAELEELGL
eukprot:symbB.v1.2.029237.t1/scaffold3175.1/size97379/4